MLMLFKWHLYLFRNEVMTIVNLIAPMRPIERNPAPQPGQQRAIELLDRDLIVSAGAGSGKTWVLTERYIEMLNHGTRPEQIVAITFTKKAAAEMKGRIRQAIAKMEGTSESREEAAYWSACRQELERAVITTIHGFCTRLLRDAPLEAGVDPGFRVLDEKEATLLERQVFSETIDGWLVEAGAAARHVYEELGDRRTVIQSALALHEQIRTHYVTKEHILNETYAALDERRARFGAIREDLLRLAATCMDMVQDVLNSKKNPPKYATDALHWLDRLETFLSRSMDWDGTFDQAITSELTSLRKNLWRNNGPKEMKDLHSQLKDKLDEWLLHTESPGYRELLHSVLEMTLLAADEYREVKRREQGLDFHDLEQLTLDMLHDHPEVAERWQHRLRYLMVDEFQDTNNVQKNILDLLTEDVESIKRFVVGDGKQSIYQFRGADVAVFNRTDTEMRQTGGEAVSLDVNFRTQHRLISYINSLFRFLMRKEEGDPDYVVAYEPLVAHRRPPHSNPAVELLATTIEKDSDNDPRQIEAERVAKRIRLMVQRAEPLIWHEQEGEGQSRPVTYGDIALLLATRTHVRTYEQALRNEGIPYMIVGGRGFYEKQEVLDVLNVLKLVQNRDDELALLGFLRSPFVHLSDETLYWLTREQRLSQAFFYLESPPAEVARDEWDRLCQAREQLLSWERVKQTENVHRLIQSILDASGYLSVLLALPNGEQAALNVEKLLDIARESTQQGHSLFDFLEWIDTLREADLEETEAEWIRDRGNAVVIMTVHASKGLEFPVVVLPELSRQLLQADGTRVLYAPGRGLAVKKFRESGEAEGDGLFDSLRDMEQDRELQEASRLFYVAVTRARDYLLLAGSQKEQKKPSDDLKNQWLDWVVKHLGAKQLSELPAGVQAPDPDWSFKVTWDLDEEHGETKAVAATPEPPANESALPCDKHVAPYPLYAPLEIGTDSPDSETLSVSALMDYTQCPRLYMLKHRLKLPPLSIGQAVKDRDKDVTSLTALDIGNVLHHVMERIEQDTVLDEHMIHACYKEGLDPSLHSEAVAQVRPLIENYCRSEWYLVSKRATRIWNELPFHYRLGAHTVSGVIDKIFIDEYGHATILDFKTNRIHDEKHFRQLVTRYELQLQVYTVVVQELLELPVKHAVLYFIQGDRPVNIEVDPSVLQQKKREWGESLSAMHRLSPESELPPCTDESCHCRQYLVTDTF